MYEFEKVSGTLHPMMKSKDCLTLSAPFVRATDYTVGGLLHYCATQTGVQQMYILFYTFIRL